MTLKRLIASKALELMALSSKNMLAQEKRKKKLELRWGTSDWLAGA